MRAGEIRVGINSDQDIVAARQRGRALATELGFSTGDATLIATASHPIADRESRTFRKPCETDSRPREAWDWGCRECAG